MNNIERIYRSHDLRSAYALWVENRRLNFGDEISATFFLLHYTLFSPNWYRNTIVDAPVFAAITEPKYPYLTHLELFVAGLHDKLVKNDDLHLTRSLHKWYYTTGISRYNLFPLLCEDEIVALSRIPSSYGQRDIELTLLDELILENSTYARRTFNFAQRSSTESFLSWKKHNDLFDCAPWIPQRKAAEIKRQTENKQAKRSAASFGNTENDLCFCGVNLIGFARTVLGLGEDLHSFARILRKIGANIALVDIPLSDQYATTSQDAYDGVLGSERPIFPINLFCIPLFETERFRLRNGLDSMDRRYNIGNWAWELSTMPDYWHHAFNYMDEIWAISPFLQGVYSNITTKPVVYMPPYVHVGEVEKFDLKELHLDGSRFIFLSLCDFNSYSSRKNPTGTVRAFQRAFPSRKSDERLIIKTLNGHVRSDDLNKLLLTIDDDPRVILVDGPYSRGKTMGLLQAVNCFVSLHRSEGFGRVLAEAMLLNTPVIATAYSGSNAILDPTTGFPVDYRLVPVLSGEYCYSEGSVWAEPNLDSAIEQMRFIVRNNSEVSVRVRQGFRRISENHGFEVVANCVAERLRLVAE